MTSLTKNLHPPIKKNIFECKLQDLPRLWAFDPVGSAYRTREILTQSRVRFGVFFRKNPWNQQDAKVLFANLI